MARTGRTKRRRFTQAPESSGALEVRDPVRSFCAMQSPQRPTHEGLQQGSTEGFQRLRRIVEPAEPNGAAASNGPDIGLAPLDRHPARARAPSRAYHRDLLPRVDVA